MMLGPLCKRGHDHEGSGQSLRYVSSRACVACQLHHHNPNTPKRVRDNAKVRSWRLQRNYGISSDEYERMLVAQSGVCAICGTHDPGGAAYFHVDHDHATGDVRGLLCRACNTALGGFKDDPALLIAAIAYIKKASPS